ncbi:hypothetical protein HOG48_04215 [Candidatus Peregrinibacteria bacterium]|jgi:hypothetical protein|nr:hypothetical protein [Candidatus Peregrinibacteria bacterium]
MSQIEFEQEFLENAARAAEALKRNANEKITEQRGRGWLPEDCESIDAPGPKVFFSTTEVGTLLCWLGNNALAHEEAEAAVSKGMISQERADELLKEAPIQAIEMIRKAVEEPLKGSSE